MYSLVGFLKGLLIQNEIDPTKQLVVQISPSSTTNTSTTITATQTANRNIAIPDASTTLVGTDATQTLTQKTIDADQNTISNIADANIKSGAAIDASKIGSGSVSNTEFGYLDGVTSSIQSQFSAGSSALTAHITDTSDAHTASAITNVPSGNLPSTDVQTALNYLQSEIDTFSGGAANPFLSNLQSPTSINQDLIPSTHNTYNLGNATKQWSNITTNRVTIGTASTQTWADLSRQTLPDLAPNVVQLRSTAISEPIGLTTIDNATNDASASGSIFIESGNKTAGTGNSGNITLRPGTSSGGTRGKILLKDGSEGTAGYVWTSTGTGGEGTWQAKPVLGISALRNFNGYTAGVTDSASFILERADQIVLQNSSNEIVITNKPYSGVTCVGTTAGPVANGRDQAGAFPANSWVHIYYIWNGTTVASLASLNGPSTPGGGLPTPPTLPSGYTHWCYVTTLKWNASNQFVASQVCGNTVYYIATSAFLSGGTATTPTDVANTSFVPPAAISYQIQVQTTIVSSAGGVADGRLTTYSNGSNAYHVLDRTLTGLAATSATTLLATELRMSNYINSGNFRYALATTSGSSHSITARVLNYQVSNGGA